MKKFQPIEKMVLRPFLLLLLVISVFSFGYDEEWEDWKKQHGKVYLSEEEEASRRGIWTANMKFIEGHNAHAKEFGYTLGMNYFGDLVYIYTYSILCIFTVYIS